MTARDPTASKALDQAFRCVRNARSYDDLTADTRRALIRGIKSARRHRPGGKMSSRNRADLETIRDEIGPKLLELFRRQPDWDVLSLCHDLRRAPAAEGRPELQDELRMYRLIREILDTNIDR